MTVIEPDVRVNGGSSQQSLATGAARNLATTAKPEPQMRAISPR
ncbi:hypothetical protein [Amycolatopsis sp. lyj-108]